MALVTTQSLVLSRVNCLGDIKTNLTYEMDFCGADVYTLNVLSKGVSMNTTWIPKSNVQA